VEEEDMKLYYADDLVQLYHGDCQDLLPTLPRHRRVLVLTDPPWGSKTRVDNRRFRPKDGHGWHTAARDHLQKRRPSVGDGQAFDPAPLLRFRRLILWGAPWYAPHLPLSGGWLVWDKRKGLEDCPWPLSDAELAWTNLGTGVHTFHHRWMGRVRESERGQHHHPQQKPIALMRWCIVRAGGPAKVSLVVDPYAGSGPTLLAAQQLGIPAIGCEIDTDYCQVIVDRLQQRALPLPAAQDGAPSQTKFMDTVPLISSETRGRGRPRKWATRAERNRAYYLSTKQKRQDG
jgi:site-specific DNA-methyltransferase (adenine-specific)